MIKLLCGQKGSGKTKVFIDAVNNATSIEKGNVVCITNGNRYLYDLKSSVRLIDTSEFDLGCCKFLYGFICGVISRDYDITHIFIDRITKIAEQDLEKIDQFLDNIEKVSNKFNINFTITITLDVTHATDKMKKYLFEF